MPKSDSERSAPEAQLRTLVDKLDPNTQKLFKSVRTALRKRFPTANELAYDYSFALVVAYAPADRGIDGIFAIRASESGVSLYFSQGPKLPDPKKLLKGSAKQVRYIELKSATNLKDPDVEALIAATLEQARIPFPSDGKGELIIKSDGKKKAVRKSAKKASK